MDYLLHILILIAIYSILVVSLDLIAGYTGLLSFAHAAFYGIGAYATALLSLHFQTIFLINMIFWCSWRGSSWRRRGLSLAENPR